MFAGPSKSTDSSAVEGLRTPVIELSDTDPEVETLPPAADDIDEAIRTLDTSSVGSLDYSTGESTYA